MERGRISYSRGNAVLKLKTFVGIAGVKLTSKLVVYALNSNIHS